MVWQAAQWTYQGELERLQKTGEERLKLYAGTLHSTLNRLDNLPYVLAHNDAVARLLTQGDNADQLNRDLESLNQWAGSDLLYVMDAEGTVLAASSWRKPPDIIGQNYAFRPYFTAAREGRQGRFFAIGTTTNQPGLFMSHAVSREGRFLGAVVVKANFDLLMKDWREGGETVLVSDVNGVIFLASRTDWLFRTLTPLPAEQRDTIRASRQYGDQLLDPAPLLIVKTLEDKNRIVQTDGQRYLMTAMKNARLEWTFFFLSPLHPVYQRTQAVATMGTILALLALALGMYARERRQKHLSRRKIKEAETIKEVNLRLQEEIEEHRCTEQALREAQAELVQSSKLAALGQLAAGIVHELNQPISAIRTHAASGRLLLDRRELEKARETFAAVTKITEHMASITTQLKTFAHQIPRKSEQVVIQACLDSALTMTAPLLNELGVALEKELPTEPVVLRGGSGQVEQVLVNLIRNGVDAMRQAPKRVLRISVTVDEGMIEIFVSDSGTGIAEKDLPELFNPFFTTKEVGQGLGLGLSISYRIISDLGGSIRAVNNRDGGASFIVRLPVMKNGETGAKE